MFLVHVDPSDVQLRHAMANVIAIILASEPRSNHLWYHMFAADALQDTYMTGFMVKYVVLAYGEYVQ